MEKLIENSVLDIVNYVINTDSYKKCLSIKEIMSKNKDLTSLIEEVKSLQKKYVKSNYSDAVTKDKLEQANLLLKDIPIYNEYMRYLDDVNQMIDLIKDELNNYFDKLFNAKND